MALLTTAQNAPPTVLGYIGVDGRLEQVQKRKDNDMEAGILLGGSGGLSK